MADWFWLGAPLVAGLLMSMGLVPLGHRVLSRGMVFADLAIAQWAALGSLVGMTLMPRHVLAGVPVTSVLSALLAVGLVHLILRRVPDHREAMIGIVYVAGASLATLLVSRDPHGAQQLAQTLNGDLLWVTPTALIPLAVVTLTILLWQLVLPERLRRRLFLVLFALAVTLSVELAGIYVVFTSLIAPPLMLCHLARRRLPAAMAVCLMGHGSGLLLSAGLDLPAGPTVVMSVLAWSLVGLVVARGSGQVNSAKYVNPPTQVTAAPES